MDEKLHKVLASQGLGSRRQMEAWITEGRVRVNGQTAHLGQRVSDKDSIEIDGKPLRIRHQQAPLQVIIYHKPAGEICTRNDPENRPTIYRFLPHLKGERWISVGRLDFNTTGLLLLTNNGELANQLMHPSSQIEREYLVRVHGSVSDDVIEQLKKGVVLEDGLARFDSIQHIGGEGSNQLYLVTLHEGRYREVRRLWEAVGAQVNRLKRTRFGPIAIPKPLKERKCYSLTTAEMSELLRAVGLDDKKFLQTGRETRPARKKLTTRRYKSR